MKDQAFKLTRPERLYNPIEEMYKIVQVKYDLKHLHLITQEDYLKSSDEERELQELHAKAVVRNFIRSADEYTSEGYRLINTVTNEVVVVYTRDEIFKENVTQITPNLSQKDLQSEFKHLESLSECENCGLPFFKSTKKTLYCCEECKKEANRSKTLKNYYNKKGVV